MARLALKDRLAHKDPKDPLVLPALKDPKGRPDRRARPDLKDHRESRVTPGTRALQAQPDRRDHKAKRVRLVLKDLRATQGLLELLDLKDHRVTLVPPGHKDRRDYKVRPEPRDHKDPKASRATQVLPGLQAQPVTPDHKVYKEYKVRPGLQVLPGHKVTLGLKVYKVRQARRDHKDLKETRARLDLPVQLALKDLKDLLGLTPSNLSIPSYSFRKL